MLGSYDTFEEFQAAHPTGDPGDTYLVAGYLYTWNDTTSSWDNLGSLIGPAGQTGPQGERGPIAATIPFSISSMYGTGVEVSTDDEGKPETINFAGFGAASESYAVRLQPGEWDSGIITIDTETIYPNSFIMPYDGILQNIYVVFANRETLYLEEGITMHPFVCIAVSDCTSLAFEILNDSIIYTEPYVGGDEEGIPKYTLRTGSSNDLNIEIAKGTLVGIVIGWVGEGIAMRQSGRFSISGGLFME